MTGMLMRVATADSLPSRLDTILLTVCESYASSSSEMLRPNWNEHVNESSHNWSVFTCCVFVLVGSPILYLTVRHTDIASPWKSSRSYKSHVLSFGRTPIPIHTFLCTMAFRVASDLEAQLQGSAWSTTPVLNHASVFSRHDDHSLFLDRGTVLSRHDDPPLPTLPPYPGDPPPEYTYPPPAPPISESDTSEPATNTVDGHHRAIVIARVIAGISVIALLVTASFFIFKHSKASKV